MSIVRNGIPFSLWPYRKIVRELAPFATGERRYVFELSCGHTISRKNLSHVGDPRRRCEFCAFDCVTLEELIPHVVQRETRPLWQRALESRA